MNRGASLLCLVAIGVSGVTSVGSPASADDESVLGQSGGSLILVLDGSGSMKEPSGSGQTRMEAAKDGLNGVINKLPADSKVGLRVYGSKIEDGKGSCKDTELLAPVDEVDKAKLKAGVKRLKPLGNTPIAYSLEQAYKDLPKEGPRSIVLVSDGEENCGGDPCKVSRDLKKRGADFYVDVVGLQVDSKSRNQLTCIASAGGGTYYDVDDISKLPSTLTRTSARAARGYEPAGIPVEGGTDASNAPDIDDGQWLDTIGDSGTEFYTVPDPGKGTLHLGAAMPPSVGSSTIAESLKIALQTVDGVKCGDGASGFVQGLTNAGAPLTVAYSATPEIRKECGKGPYVLSVETPEISGVQPLEVLVRAEPAVTSAANLPAAVNPSDFSDTVKGDAPSSAAPSAIGGPNYSSAPPTAPGTYTDAILSGETLFYRVPDVAWGQQVSCDFTTGKAATVSNVLDANGYSLAVTARVYGPLKSEIVDLSSTTSRLQYDGTAATTMHAASPAVRYRNRESLQDVPRASALDGDYYCALTVKSPTSSHENEIGEIPLSLTVSLVGTAGEGAPKYASKPKPTENEKQKDAAVDDGLGLAWIVGGVIALAALLLVLWLRFRSRRSTPES